MMLRIFFLGALMSVFSVQVEAQSAAQFQRNFQSARNMMKEGKYSEAMNAFNDLTYSHKKNQFVAISHYYYAVCAHKIGDGENAGLMLSKLVSNHADWAKIDEAYYLQSVLAYEQGDFEMGDIFFDKIRGSLKGEKESVRNYHLQQTDDITKLIDLLEKERDNDFLRKLILSKITSGTLDGKKKMLLEYMAQDHQVDRDQFSAVLDKKSVFKDEYKVALMLPFKLPKGSISAPPGTREQKYYEMFEGIRIAADSLKEEGINIKVYAYDTEKDTTKVKELLATPELATFDLIIGPIWSKNAQHVSNFAEMNGINYINPTSSRGNEFESKANTFFYKPSGVTLAEKCADYSLAHFDSTKANVIIFYGKKNKDSTMAYTYRKRMLDAGKNVVVFKEIGQNNPRDFEISLIRQNPRSVSHIIVCSENRFVGAHLLHPLEDQDYLVPVMVPSRWLDIHTITYSQFARRNFHFIYPDYIDGNKPVVKEFRKKLHEHFSRPVRSAYAYTGFEIMYGFGKYLNEHGTLFNTQVQSGTYKEGTLSYGTNFNDKLVDNQVVPILIFNEDFEFEWLNKPE